MAAIGPGTAAALAEHGIRADVVPERFVAESLVQALEQVPVSRALIARAGQARDVLPDALRARGAEVDVVALYETVAEPLSERALRGGQERGLHHLHLLIHGELLPGGGRRRGRTLAGDAGRVDRPRHHGRAGRRRAWTPTWRPSGTTSTA